MIIRVEFQFKMFVCLCIAYLVGGVIFLHTCEVRVEEVEYFSKTLTKRPIEMK